MEFRKYNKIKNVKDSSIRWALENMKDDTFYVTEKVHGANISFWVNKDEFKIASRTRFLDPTDNFHGIQHHAESIEQYIRLLFDFMCDVDELVLYGEIFGGSYPHPDVAQNSTSSRVQKGVFYCEQNAITIFDIEYDGKVMPLDMAEGACMVAGLPFVQPLFKGTLLECLNYPNEFQTKFPEAMGLPSIEGNMCEGVIIRPVEPAFDYRGNPVIFKSKNAKFTESNGGKAGKTGGVVSDPELMLTVAAVSERICMNRLENVISHDTRPESMSDFGGLLKRFATDVLFCRETEDLSGHKLNTVKREVTRRCALFMRANWSEVVA